MSSIWTLANIKELEFAATATILAIKAKTRSLSATDSPDIDSSDESEPEHDEEEDNATSRPTARLTTFSQDAFIDKFLDRLAEVFSCVKSSSGRQGSKHVAATAWIRSVTEVQSPLIVILAKNEGLDNRDRNMASRLQLWFRTVAVTGRHPPTLSDRIWIGDNGLVEYSRSRLWYHISQINKVDQSINELAARSASYSVLISRLQYLCRDATFDSTTHQLSEIVNVAYSLRCAWKTLRAYVEPIKALRSINMLGRLQAAYECFKTVSLTFEGLSTMEIRPVEDLHHPLVKDVPLFKKHFETLAEEFGLPTGCHKNNTARTYIGASHLHVHAEIQILVSLATKPEWHERASLYIGISKKPCFQCNLILHNYSKLSMEGTRKRTFRTRLSHGRVYPLWTLPHIEISPRAACLALAAAIAQTYGDIRHLLQQQPVTRAALAESSAGVTDSTSSPGGLTTVQKQYLMNQRILNSSKRVNEGEDPIILGRKIKSVRVGLLPADGSKPRLIKISFHALPDKPDHRIREFQDLVPDFHDSWGECQFDRRFREVKYTNKDRDELQGDYRLYWNENHELPENVNIKNFLGIDSVNTFRRFWYGDAFVVRFSEHFKPYAYDIYDTPSMIFQGPQLKAVFQEMWQTLFLEDELERDSHDQARVEKAEVDEGIILRRMTPIERDILSRLPISTLQYLAITGCDDGAMRDFSMEEDPHDPTMVRISTMMKTTALDSMGWSGFDSSHL